VNFKEAKMEFLTIIISAVAGYLMGSISFARIVASRVKPEADITKYYIPIPNTDLVYEDDAVSATLVNLNLGWQYGCLTSILDMIKVIVPMVAFRLVFPAQPYYLTVSAAAIVGHNWPIYHKFQGGRGESVFYGSMLLIDPLGAVICNVGAVILGIIIGQINMIRWGGMALLIPWLWIRTSSPIIMSYIIFMNVVFWIAMRKDIKQFYLIYRAGGFQTQAEWSDFLDMSSRPGHFIDQYSLPALLKRLS
jgi:acyl phosphate:glycerol-3-phosphate acyltransferase